MEEGIEILLVGVKEERENLLSLLKKKFPQTEVNEAENGHQGLEKARELKPHILIASYRLEDMDAAEFCRALKGDPSTDRAFLIMLTDSSPEPVVEGDDSDADDFLSSPVRGDTLFVRINSFLKTRRLQWELAESNRLLEESFKGTIDILLRFIDERLKTGEGGRASRRKMTQWIAQKMGIPPQERRVLEIAVDLFEIGKALLPREILDKNPSEMNEKERALYNQYPVVGELMLLNIPRLNKVARVIRHQFENIDGSGIPDGLTQGEVSTPARILRGLVAWREAKALTRGRTLEERLGVLRDEGREKVDGAVIEYLVEYLTSDSDRDFFDDKYTVPLFQLKEGMVLGEDLYTAAGIKMLTAKTEITEGLIEKLVAHHSRDPIINLIYVYK